MWDVPSYRIKTYLRNMRAQQAKDRSRSKRDRMHIRRVKALVRVSSGLGAPVEIIDARLILNEFGPAGIRLYTTRPLTPGQEVSITIEEPRYFFAHARVAATQNVGFDRNIIAVEPYDYRVALLFKTHTTAEENAISSYVSELLSNLIHLPAGSVSR